MAAETFREIVSSLERGRSMTLSMPFLPRIQGSARAILFNPYWPVRTLESGTTFFPSLIMVSTMWVTAEAMP